ncbi:MAG: PAS domain-containing protein [Bacteroidia bacterium]|nr:PAS domain-containing protein [Bacteroidia bacterium]
MNTPDDFREFCRKMEFDLNLNDYKDSLIDWNKLDDILILNNQFFFINDFKEGFNIYVHPNVEAITGFPKESFREFDFTFSITHQDDYEYVNEISKRGIKISQDYKEELLKDPFCGSFSVDFRLRCRNGSYIRVNRHSCCFKTDTRGNIVYGLALFTDISHLKKGDHITFTYYGNEDLRPYFDDLIKKYDKNFQITNREKDVLGRLAKGFSATEIANQLSLSVHTVISHRKNLLHKTRTKNTAELVKFALEKDLI